MGSTAPRTWLVALVIAIAVLAHSPGLSWGFYGDDFGQQLVIEGAMAGYGEGSSARMRPWSLFDFGYAPEPNSGLAASGLYPWWVSPDWKLRFFRPLASLTHWLDHTLFGRAAALHHAMSLGYFALLLVLLHALYRAAGIAPRTALIALAIFACDDGSLVAVDWLANRNALLEALFAVAAALVALRTRERPSVIGVAGACALALGACLSKESGITAPLLVALGYASRRDSKRARIAAGCAVALAAAYLAFWIGAGFGSRSAFYPTPWFEGATWLANVAQLAAFAPLAFAAPNPFDLAIFNAELLAPWIVVSLLLGIPLLIAVARERRALPHAGFFAAWIALTLLPQAGAPPSERLLFVPMVGAAAWLAVFVERAFTASSWSARLAPLGVGVVATALSCLLLFQRGLFFRDQVAVPMRAAVLTAAVPHEHPRPTTVVVLQSPSQILTLSPAPAWTFLTGDRDLIFAPLQWGRRGLRWRAIDERTLELHSLDEPFLDSVFEPVFLSSRAAIEAGTRWRAAGFEVEALEPEGRGLRAIRVRFDLPLTDPRWRFVTWRDGRFVPLAPPAVGASSVLPSCEPLVPMLP